MKLKTQGDAIGDSTAKHGALDFSKGMMCHAFTYEVASQYDAGSAQLVGRRVHKCVTIVREVDKASPLLFAALCSNETFTQAKLSFVRPDNAGKLALYHSILLETGAVVRYRTFHGIREGGGDSIEQVHTNELEEFDMVFQKITYSNDANSKQAIDNWQAHGQ
ncbi:MAG TPA: type VI secretion system tube protein TssD [Polyangiaceae bacterium]